MKMALRLLSRRLDSVDRPRHAKGHQNAAAVILRVPMPSDDVYKDAPAFTHNFTHCGAHMNSTISNRRRSLWIAAGLTAVFVGCESSPPMSSISPSANISVGNTLSTLSVSAVSSLGTCNAANMGTTVLLVSGATGADSGTGAGTLYTCNGTTWLAAQNAVDGHWTGALRNERGDARGLHRYGLGRHSVFNGCLSLGSGILAISGTVTGPNGPVAGAKVSISGSAQGAIATDGNGNYAFTGLSSGGYSVSVSAPNCSFANSTVNLNNVTTSQAVTFTATTATEPLALADLPRVAESPESTGATGATGVTGVLEQRERLERRESGARE